MDAVYAPAAEALHSAHDVLAAANLDHEDTDAIRRAGGKPLAVWAAALAAQEVYAYTP